ncbi:hypothetical protein T05_4353 [Trichinella murrelli]|uniref:Uncharacterized protein n=1 Tax=Trichinella murrelli TaxID=144512 RepID=A0A0V0U337_9BILA|nr:hypothetical protein T05_4353 [Trichinella murrelli]
MLTSNQHTRTQSNRTGIQYLFAITTTTTTAYHTTTDYRSTLLIIIRPTVLLPDLQVPVGLREAQQLLVVGLRLLHYFPLHAEHVPCSPSLVHMKSRNHAGRRVHAFVAGKLVPAVYCLCTDKDIPTYGFILSKSGITGNPQRQS